jgi:hypothetical protein
MDDDDEEVVDVVLAFDSILVATTTSRDSIPFTKRKTNTTRERDTTFAPDVTG